MKAKGRANALKLSVISITCLFLIYLSGCISSSDFEKTTLRMSKNGSITQYIIEPFDESVYNYDELVAQCQKDIEDCNTTLEGEKVILESSEVIDGYVHVTINYADDNAYYSFNDVPIFFGSCKRAANVGYNPVGKVVSVQNGEQLDKSTWENMNDSYKIIVLHEATSVSVTSNILFISDGVTCDSSNTASTDGSDIEYIIY